MRYILALLILSSYLYSAQVAKQKLDRVSLQLHWKYQFEFAGFIAAKEKGFYKDAGLDVTLKEYDNGIDIEKDVVAAISEYGIYNSRTLVNYMAGEPLKLVASFFKRSALVLVTTPDIRSPKDLVGKKIMAGNEDDFILSFKPYLDGYGVSIDDIELVPHTYKLDSFVAGEVSAMTSFISDEVYKLEQKKINYNILDPSDDNIYTLQLELFTSKKEATQHPERVSAFRDASIKGWQYALAHKEELSQIIAKKYSTRVSEDELMGEAKEIEKLILPYTYDIGSIDRNFLNKQVKLFKSSSSSDKDIDLDGYIFKDKIDLSKVVLSDDEKIYIKNNPLVNICLQKDSHPINGYKDGKIIGMMADVYSFISTTTSLKFKPVMTASTKDIQTKIDSKECKMLSVYPTKDRTYSKVSPTNPFLATHFTVLGGLDSAFVSDANNFKNKTFLTQRKSLKYYLMHFYPYLNIEVEEDITKMIDRLEDKEVDAIIVVDEESDYIINKYGYGWLKVTGFLAKEYPLEVSIGVSSNEPILLSIINKALEKITRSQIEIIRNHWKVARYEVKPDYTILWIVVSVMSVILLIMLYYQRKLRSFNFKLEDRVLLEIQKNREKDKQLLNQSRQAQMGEMLSMIAHQWRQPLAAIGGLSASLELKVHLDKIDNELVLESAQNISKFTQQLSTTIDDFKNFFKPSKETTIVTYRDIIDSVLGIVRLSIENKNIKIVVDCRTNNSFATHQNEVKQVVLNLIKNAEDVLQEKEIENPYIKIITYEEDEKQVLEVRDNGGGIANDILPKIFDPYFSTKKKKNGTGLGLYMSKMIISEHCNGKIYASNSEDGAVIKIVL